MPKPKYDDPEGSKRFLETAQKYAAVPPKQFDRALRDVASAPPAPAAKPKPRAKRAK